MLPASPIEIAQLPPRAVEVQSMMNAPAQFDHDRLDVYHAVIDFVGLAGEIVEALPRGRAYVKDQLSRAALSIATNLAEGAGEFKRKDKARFHRGRLPQAPSR